MYIDVSLVGVFDIKADTAEQFQTLLHYNTVAMMMPYIRSQITLLTAQPGLAPLVMPPIDVNKLVDKAPTVRG